MGACKDMFMDEVEQIGDQFGNGDMTRERAVRRLVSLGFHEGEAEILLDEATQ